MRWFLGILLVANVLMLVWGALRAPIDHSTTGLPAPDVGTLRLLTEVPATEKGSAITASTKVVAASGANDRPWSKSPVSNENDKDAKPAEHIVEVAQEQLDAEALKRSLRARQDMVPLPSPELSEQPPQLPEASSAAIAGSAKESVCVKIGDFESPGEAGILLQSFGLKYAQLQTSKNETDVVTGYYVIIPPSATRGIARQTVDALKTAGIVDSWIFPSGNLKHAISLGLFSKESNAQRRMKRVDSKGFSAIVLPRKKPVVNYRATLELDAGQAGFDGLQASDKYISQGDSCK